MVVADRGSQSTVGVEEKEMMTLRKIRLELARSYLMQAAELLGIENLYDVREPIAPILNRVVAELKNLEGTL